MTRRLVAAFAVVALLSVGVLAALTLVASRSEVADLVAAQNRATLTSVAQELAGAYVDSGRTWLNVDQRAARALAVAANASLVVRDAAGRVVPGTGPGRGAGPGSGRMTSGVDLGAPETASVVVDGINVGSAELRFPAAQPAPERQVRTALLRTVLWGSGLALAVSVAVGAIAGSWIRRPVARLTHAARAMAAGDREIRVGPGSGGAELRQLAAAFDGMANALQREDELRRAVAADVAHELRTPVAIAQGELEALLDGIAEPTPDRIGSVHQEVLRLGRRIEDLEMLAAAQAAGLRMRRESVDLAAVAGGAARSLTSIANQAGVEVRIRDQGRALVTGDADRLGQIASNLILNAVKYTPAGGCVCTAVTGRDETVELTVTDTGPGFPQGQETHAFERFWRAADTAHRPGRGIGLAVVAELTKAHGGRVTASNVPSGGARVVVTLPAAGCDSLVWRAGTT